MTTARDPELFSALRVKQEFQRALDFCTDAGQRRDYLHAVGYYGCVGERSAITENARAIVDYVQSALDPDVVDCMYELALQYFKCHYAQPHSARHHLKTVDGTFTLLLRPAPDRRLLEIGRIGSASDAHYVMRARLYGFTRGQLREWPLGGVYVAKCCHHCNAPDCGLLLQCALCGDAFYCSAQCQRDAQPGHAAYCGKSAKCQEVVRRDSL
jgi:hypothetical protein